MKEKFPMVAAAKKLKINYDVADREGVKALNPKDNVNEHLAMSAMYSIFWQNQSVYNTKEEIDKVIPFINKDSLLPIYQSKYDQHKLLKVTIDQPKEVVDYAINKLYRAIQSMAGSLFTINIFYACNEIRIKYPEVFEKVRHAANSITARRYYIFKHKAFKYILENTMFTIHDYLIDLQKFIPQFISEGNNPKLLVGTQEEIDKEAAFIIACEKAIIEFSNLVNPDEVMKFADEYFIERFSNIENEPNEQEFYEGRKKFFKDLIDVTDRVKLSNSTKPIEDGIITDDEYSNIQYTIFEWNEFWEDIPFIINFELPGGNDIDWDNRYQDYLKAICKNIENYYCYYWVSNLSGVNGYDQPVHWLEFEGKFNANYGKPIELLHKLLDYCGQEGTYSMIGGCSCFTHPFFDYAFDPKLTYHDEYRPMDDIAKSIIHDGSSFGSFYLPDMQTMFTPYNFVEEFCVPMAHKAQSHFGKDQVASKTEYYNLETGEVTRTTFGPHDKKGPGDIYQSTTSGQLKSINKAKTSEQHASQERYEYQELLAAHRKAHPEEYVQIDKERKEFMDALKAGHKTKTYEPPNRKVAVDADLNSEVKPTIKPVIKPKLVNNSQDTESQDSSNLGTTNNS
jgi:hypothetical protein